MSSAQNKNYPVLFVVKLPLKVFGKVLCWLFKIMINKEQSMSTTKFEATPTASEGIDLTDISAESVKDAWKNYEAKPEFKDFNKHDMIESMQSPKPDESKA